MGGHSGGGSRRTGVKSKAKESGKEKGEQREERHKDSGVKGNSEAMENPAVVSHATGTKWVAKAEARGTGRGLRKEGENCAVQREGE